MLDAILGYNAIEFEMLKTIFKCHMQCNVQCRMKCCVIFLNQCTMQFRMQCNVNQNYKGLSRKVGGANIE